MLKLVDVRKPLSFKVIETSLVQYADELLQKDYWTIDYDVYLPSKGKNLQREFCWTNEQKSELIISMLKGIHIAPISIIYKRFEHTNHSKDIVLQIIDGKQRLSAILGFIKNEFPVIVNSNEYYFTDLDTEAQYAVNHGVPMINLVYEWIYDDGVDNVIISDDDKIAWFEMINWAGTPQDIEHMNNLKK